MKIKRKQVAVLAMSLLLAVSGVGHFERGTTVSAGVSNQPIISEGDYVNTLPQNIWFTDEDSQNVTVADSVITFANTEAGSRIGLRKSVRNQQVKAVSFTLNATFSIATLPTGARFGFGFGLKRMRSVMQEKGSKFLCFEGNGDGVKLALYAFDSTGVESKLFDTGSLVLEKNAPIAVEFTVGTDDSVLCKVGENTFTLPAGTVNGEGYLGFGQNDLRGVTASVSALSIKAYENTTPKNTNVYENFNNDAFNSRTINTYAPLGALPDSYLEARDGALRFQNAPKNAMLGTVYQYSNFVLGFTLCDLQRMPAYNEKGELTKSVSCGFAVALGCLSQSSKKTSVELMLEVNPVGGTPVSPAKYTEIVLKSENILVKRVLLSDKYNLWATENEGKDFDFRITMTDGVLALSVKGVEETGFTEVFYYDHGATPVGHIQISSVDGFTARQAAGVDKSKLWQGNFALDNFTVRNRDVNAQITMVDYANNKAPIPSDYEYEDTWDEDDLLQDELG